MPNLFGTIVSAAEVEARATTTLKTWMTTYLAEIERRTSRPPRAIPAPRSYRTLASFDHFAEDQLPCVTIVSPGLAGPPRRRGDGTYIATWTLGIGVIVSAKDQDSTNALAKDFATVVRAILLQQGSLGNFTSGMTWVDEDYTELNPSDNLSLAVATVIFNVDVDGVIDSSEGPKTVPADPYVDPGGWPTVLTTYLDVEKEAIA